MAGSHDVDCGDSSSSSDKWLKWWAVLADEMVGIHDGDSGGSSSSE